MELKQSPVFQPIHIVIETSEEAEAIWAALDDRPLDRKQQETVNQISNWFSQVAQLIGA